MIWNCQSKIKNRSREKKETFRSKDHTNTPSCPHVDPNSTGGQDGKMPSWLGTKPCHMRCPAIELFFIAVLSPEVNTIWRDCFRFQIWSWNVYSLQVYILLLMKTLNLLLLRRIHFRKKILVNWTAWFSGFLFPHLSRLDHMRKWKTKTTKPLTSTDQIIGKYHNSESITSTFWNFLPF